MKIKAEASLPVFIDVSRRWHRDMGRLVQSVRIPTDGIPPDAGIRPAKYVGFIAFWVRKLKPISRAFKHADIVKQQGRYKVDSAKEVRHINELVAIKLAVEVLREFLEANLVTVPNAPGSKPTMIEWNPEAYEAELKSFFDQKLGPDGMSVIESLLYDMRYRTFGPHHLVHLFDQLVFNLKPAAS